MQFLYALQGLVAGTLDPDAPFFGSSYSQFPCVSTTSETVC